MIKRIFFLVCLIFFVAGSLLSCKSSAPVQPTETVKTITVKETQHDTVFKIREDKSYYQAYLDCVNGKVVIKEEKSTPSEQGYLQPPQVKIEDNKLTADCEARARELLAQWTAKHTTEVTVQKVPFYIEKQLTFFQKVQLWAGRVFLACLLILAIALFFNFKKSFK